MSPGPENLRQALDRLVATSGSSVMVIAHRLSTVRQAEPWHGAAPELPQDEIICLREGHVVERGTSKELMELRGYYFTLVEKQAAPRLKSTSICALESRWAATAQDITHIYIIYICTAMSREALYSDRAPARTSFEVVSARFCEALCLVQLAPLPC